MTNNNVDNFFEHPAGLSTDNELVLNGSVRSSEIVQQVTNTVTLAEINAGKTIVAGVAGRTIQPKNFVAVVNGTFLTGTSVELEDTNGSPVGVFSTAAAGLTDAAVIVPGEANTTLNAGFLGNLTAGEGLAVTATGSAFTGGTDITISVQYTLI